MAMAVNAMVLPAWEEEMHIITNGVLWHTELQRYAS